MNNEPSSEGGSEFAELREWIDRTTHDEDQSLILNRLPEAFEALLWLACCCCSQLLSFIV